MTSTPRNLSNLDSILEKKKKKKQRNEMFTHLNQYEFIIKFLLFLTEF